MIRHIQRIAILSIVVLAALPAQNLAAGVAGTTGISTPGYGQSISSIQDQVRSLRTKVEHIKYIVDLSSQERDAVKGKVQAGLAPQSDLTTKDAQLTEAMGILEQAMLQLRNAERLAALAKPVDAEVKDATVHQIAEVLSKSASVKITVDPRVSKDQYVTLQVEGTPLAKVLEMVAGATNLMIAPGEDGSVLLTLPSTMTIDGMTIESRSDSFPWSTEWPYSNDPSSPRGDRWLGLVRAAMPTSTSSAPVWAAGGTSQPVITSMSPNTFIVAEPGTNDKGEAGMWLTFYSIDSGKMIPGIKYFHRSSTAKSDPPPAPAPKGKSAK